ncbi:MAG: hypothetical protein ABFR82_09175 [Nitrospirota bacterium]
MKKNSAVNHFKLNYSVIICSLLVIIFVTAGFSYAKIYIDIASPGIRKLPITIKSRGPSKTKKELEWIIKRDLDTTGMFEFVDPDVPGGEIVADMLVSTADGLSVILSVNDLIEGEEVLKIRLSSSKMNTRSMAHSIANHIYKVATGKKGIFRTKISYLVNSSSGRKNLRVMDWDGFNSTKIVSRGLTSGHSWSQDGQHLLYSSERKRKWKIFVRNLKQPRETVLFSSKGLNLVGGTSPDDLVSFSSSKDGSSEIYVINLRSKGLKKLTRSFGIDVSPVFSHDGKKIAFVSDRGGTPQIYTMDANGRGAARLTFEGPYNQSPSWSSNGKWITYAGRKNGKIHIFVVKSDGKDLRQLTFEGNNESPSFSPDGFLIAFESDREGARGIYIMRLNGEGKKRITPKNIKATAPRWSPYLK